ncbi:unnamed protein product [marine sediment metagenome]|uniref:Uncharacterized protein n=1 Tax=marine sediment metagenome TaxID=412755 RepID=X0TY15_9ZZZZ
MIKLMKFIAGETWKGKWVWVKHDHITFLSEGTHHIPNTNGSTMLYTTITTIGGGQINVYESPHRVMEQMPARSQ